MKQKRVHHLMDLKTDRFVIKDLASDASDTLSCTAIGKTLGHFEIFVLSLILCTNVEPLLVKRDGPE